MLKEMGNDIDAVIVSTPDHTHAPASLMAMEMNKPVYCQKPLTHYVEEARAMDKMAKDKKLVTQMGIQVHSFYDYKLATMLIQDGIIGKVHTVRAWSPKNWGYDGPIPTGSDPVPENLDWNLWLGYLGRAALQRGCLPSRQLAQTRRLWLRYPGRYGRTYFRYALQCFATGCAPHHHDELPETQRIWLPRKEHGDLRVSRHESTPPIR